MTRINTAKAAELLGVKAETVRDYVARGYLRAVTNTGTTGNGKRLYFDPDEVKAFVTGGAPAARVYRDSQPIRVSARGRLTRGKR